MCKPSILHANISFSLNCKTDVPASEVELFAIKATTIDKYANINIVHSGVAVE